MALGMTRPRESRGDNGVPRGDRAADARRFPDARPNHAENLLRNAGGNVPYGEG